MTPPSTFPFNGIRHLLVDLDGVIYRGDEALPGACRFLSWLKERKISARLVTNNATLTPVQYVRKLESMGIDVSPDEVFTSALATALYLRERKAQGQSAYVIGEEGLEDALRGVDIHLVQGDPDWVVVGLDRHLTYDKLERAVLAIKAGARFVGTNPDTSLPTEHGLAPGAGAILAALTATTGVKPLVVGKPEPLMLSLAMKHLGGGVHDTAMLGDRLDTDIEGARAAGIPSILVLTGVSTRRDLERGDIHPTLVVDNLPALVSRWDAALAGAAGA